MRVLTFGTFDQLHPGHIAYLKQAEDRGALLVLVARDENVEKFKGRRPEENEDTRVANVLRHFPKATVVLGEHDDYLHKVRELNHDLILLGYDQKMPPGIAETDLPAPVERAEPYKPEEFKSSLRRGQE